MTARTSKNSDANNDMEAAQKPTETAVALREFSNDELLSISTFEDAARLVEEVYGDVLLADQVIGNGFRLLTDKNKLVDVPFIALQWKFLDGDFNRPYTNLLVVTDSGSKYLVNDGGSGITRDLMEFSNRTGRTGGVVVRGGLSASTYDFCSACGSTECVDESGTHRMTPATTFYLNLTA